MANIKRTAIMEELKRKALNEHQMCRFIANVKTSSEWHALATDNERRRAPKFLNWTGRA